MSSSGVLVVEHEAQCPPGWMGEWLAEAGVPLDVRRPYAGDRLPEDLTGHADAGPGRVDGRLRRRAAPLAHRGEGAVRRAARPRATLGICLGHQLVAVALGGAVHPNPRGQQIGVLDVGWTEAAPDDAFGR